MAETAEKQGTALEIFMGEMLPPDRATELYASLPKHINRDRFNRNLWNAMMQSPDLMRYDPHLVYREVSRIAALGLLLDRDLGEAYLIEAWNGKTQRKEPQARIGYRGLIKLAKQSGKIKKINAREVRKNDFFDILQGSREELVHKPLLFGDPGSPIAYYSVVTMNDGDTDFERMTIDEVHGIRDRSDAWRAFKDGKIKLTPWATDEGEMAKKTVIRRLCKRVEQSPELAEAIRIEDEAEFSHMRDVTPVAARPTLVAPPAPKAPIVAPHQGGRQRPASPKRVTIEPRKKGAYKDMARQEPLEAEQATPKGAGGGLRYAQEDSGAHLDALVRDLGDPMTPAELHDFVVTNAATVQRMIPEHQKIAEQRLADRAIEVLDGPNLPSFLPGDDGAP